MNDAQTAPDAQNTDAQHDGAPILENGQGYAAPQLSETQSAALKEIANLRAEYATKPSDALLQRMAKLQSFALANGEKPADFLPGDPAAPDLSEHDEMAGAFSGLSRP